MWSWQKESPSTTSDWARSAPGTASAASGSSAPRFRGTLRPDSDIDLLVEFEPARTPGLLSIARLELELGELLGRQADLRTLHDLSRHFREQVAAEARTLYDAA